MNLKLNISKKSPPQKPPSGQPPWIDGRFGGPPGQKWGRFFWYLVLLLIIFWFWQSMSTQLNVRAIPYSQFKALAAQKRVADLTISETEISGRVLPKPAVKPGGHPAAPAQATPQSGAAGAYQFQTGRVADPDLVRDLQKEGIQFTGAHTSFISQFVLIWLLPILAMVFLWRVLARRIGSIGQGVMGFGSSKAKVVADKDTGVTFGDVAGCEEAKYELQEVVSFLKNPGRYKALGAIIPKGILLVGPPGTGKTLLARAVAGKPRYRFFSSAAAILWKCLSASAPRGSAICLHGPNPRPPALSSSMNWTRWRASGACTWVR